MMDWFPWNFYTCDMEKKKDFQNMERNFKTGKTSIFGKSIDNKLEWLHFLKLWFFQEEIKKISIRLSRIVTVMMKKKIHYLANDVR